MWDTATTKSEYSEKMEANRMRPAAVAALLLDAANNTLISDIEYDELRAEALEMYEANRANG